MSNKWLQVWSMLQKRQSFPVLKFIITYHKQMVMMMISQYFRVLIQRLRTWVVLWNKCPLITLYHLMWYNWSKSLPLSSFIFLFLFFFKTGLFCVSLAHTVDWVGLEFRCLLLPPSAGIKGIHHQIRLFFLLRHAPTWLIFLILRSSIPTSWGSDRMM